MRSGIADSPRQVKAVTGVVVRMLDVDLKKEAMFKQIERDDALKAGDVAISLTYDLLYGPSGSGGGNGPIVIMTNNNGIGQLNIEVFSELSTKKELSWNTAKALASAGLSSKQIDDFQKRKRDTRLGALPKLVPKGNASVLRE